MSWSGCFFCYWSRTILREWRSFHIFFQIITTPIELKIRFVFSLFFLLGQPEWLPDGLVKFLASLIFQAPFNFSAWSLSNACSFQLQRDQDFIPTLIWLRNYHLCFFYSCSFSWVPFLFYGPAWLFNAGRRDGTANFLWFFLVLS